MKDFSSFVPILIAIAFGLFQLFKMFGKGDGTPRKPQSPPPTDPFGGRQEGSWDDLMEALGQKEKPKNSGPVQVPPPVPRVEPVQPKSRPTVYPTVARSTPQPQRQTLPPIPQTKIPEKTSEPFEFYQPKIAEESALKFKNFDTENAEASHAPVLLAEPTASKMPNSRFRQFLSNRQRLREAIVLNEILNKPVALR